MKKRIAILLSLAMVLSPMTPFARGPLAPITVFAADYTANNFDELVGILDNGVSAGDTIIINKYMRVAGNNVVLDFNGATVKGTSSFEQSNSHPGALYLFTIDPDHADEGTLGGGASNATIKNANITIEGSFVSGAINVTGGATVSIENVTIDGGKAGIMVGNGANNVTVDNVTARNNPWYGVGVFGTSTLAIGSGGLNTPFVVKVETAMIDSSDWAEDPDNPGVFIKAEEPEVHDDEGLIEEAEALLAATLPDGTPEFFDNGLRNAIDNLKKASDNNRENRRNTLKKLVDEPISRKDFLDLIAEAEEAMETVSDAAPIFEDALDAEITAAKILADGDKVTKNQVGKLETAIENFNTSAEGYTRLAEAIAKADAIVAAGTFTIPNNFNAALTNAKNAFNATNPTTNAAGLYASRAGTLEGRIETLLGVVDITKLGELIEALEAVVASATDYSNYDELDVVASLTSAKEVYENPIATKVAVEAQVAILENIIDKLEYDPAPIPPTDDELIDDAKALLAATLTDGTLKYFDNGLAKAIENLEKANDNNHENRRLTLQNLVDEVVSREELLEAIKAAEEAKKTLSNPVPIFKDVLEAEIAKVQVLADGDKATTKNIGNQIDKLDTAVDNFNNSFVPFASLTEAIRKAEAIVVAGAPTTTQAFTNALNNAKIASERTNATAGTIDTYASRAATLEERINGLLGDVNKDELKVLIDELNDIVPENYVSYSSSLVGSALVKAEAVYKNPVATSGAVEEQVIALNAIKGKLKLIDDLVEEAKALRDEKLTDYDDTPAYFNNGWRKLDEAIENYESKIKQAQALTTMEDALEDPSSLVSKAPLAASITEANEVKATVDTTGATERYVLELSTAIGNAETFIKNDKNVTEANRDREITKLKTAIDNLALSKEASERLEAAIDDAGKVETDKELATTSEFDKALRAAKNAMGAPDKTTIDKYKSLAQDLEDIILGLEGVPASDTKTIADAREAVAGDLYFNPSKAQLQAALTRYDEALNANQRANALQTVEARLLALVAKAPLEDAVASATTAINESIKESGAKFYSDKLWVANLNAIGVLSGTSNVSEAKRITEIKKLTDAIDNLEKADKLKAELIELLAEANKVVNPTQTLTRAISAAKPNDSINMTRMQKQYDDLDAALKAVVPPVEVDKAALTNIIAEADALKSADYTNFSTINTPLTSAKAIMAKANATQAEVNSAVSALRTAINNLKAVVPVVVDKAVLTNIIAEADALKSADYTNFSTISTPLTSAKAIMAKANAIQTEVNSAVSALRTAIDNLKKVGNNGGNAKLELVGALGTSKRLILTGDTEGMTIVIVKVSGAKETYTYSTATTVILPRGATCYVVNLSVDATKARIAAANGALFVSIFGAEIEDYATN